MKWCLIHNNSHNLVFIKYHWTQNTDQAIFLLNINAMLEIAIIPSLFLQVTWLVLTEVQSKSFRLVTERRHEIRRAMCHQSYFCLLVGAECKRQPIFHCRVWYRAISLHYACFRSSGIILIPRLPLCQISYRLFSPIAELANGEKSRTQSLNHSLTHPTYLMPQKPKLLLQKSNETIMVLLCNAWNLRLAEKWTSWFSSLCWWANIQNSTDLVRIMIVI